MVLEAAFYEPPPSGDSFDGGSDTPDASKNAPELRVDLSKASRPFPILGPLLGFTEAQLVTMARGVAMTTPKLLNRSLTQDELDGVVAAASKYQQWHSWIYANGMIVGFFRGRQTAAEFRFPLHKMFAKQVEKINRDRLGALQGQMARSGWNMIRMSLWIAWWSLPSYIFGGILGQLAMTTVRINDERLAQFNKELRGDAVRQKISELATRSSERQSTDSMSNLQGTNLEGDMSPQAGRDAGFMDQTSEPTTYSSQKDSAPTPWPRAVNKADSRSIETARSRQPYESQPTQNWNKASGGSAWDQVRSQGGRTESAWDRVRRGQAGTGGDDASPRSTAGGADDSFPGFNGRD